MVYGLLVLINFVADWSSISWSYNDLFPELDEFSDTNRSCFLLQPCAQVKVKYILTVGSHVRTSWWVTRRERRVASRDVTVRETSCSLKTAHAWRRASAVVNTTTSFTRRGMYLLWIVQSMWSYLLHWELAKVRFINILRIVSQGPYWPCCYSLLYHITPKSSRNGNEK